MSVETDLPASRAENREMRSIAPLDIRSLRFPAEPSRLVMAVVSVAAAFGVLIVWLIAVDLPFLIYGGLVLMLSAVSIWLAVQFHRLRRLGDAVLVSSETLPQVQSVVDEIRATLGYDKRVDIFVVPNLSPRIQLESYFGIRALLIEGGAVADLTAPACRPQLLYLLGTYFGAFAAKHDRWPVTEFVLDNAGIRKIMAPFVAPWLRATVYTGDQIAFVCSHDFRVSLAAAYRILVGRELSPQLAPSGLILQAGRVSRSWVLRLAEAFRPVPHATNRFLNLVRFAQETDPESVLAFRAELPPTTNAVLDESLARLAQSANRKAGVIVVTLGAIVLSLLLMGLGLQAMPTGATPSDSTADGSSVVEPTDVVGPTDEVVDPTDEVVEPVVPTVTESLIAAVPASLAASCGERTESMPQLTAGLVASIGCLGNEGGFDRLQVYAYDSSESVVDAFAYFAGSLDEGLCTAQGRGSWIDDTSATRGALGCYYDGTGGTVAVWTYDLDQVLVVGSVIGASLDDILLRWQAAAPQLGFD